ncbi:hypothetical protein Bbelb_412240 [Branchiostoma belcheri]|nr:hypothetical protein Bbelb_412240 [Branchiostoma belcheri]
MPRCSRGEHFRNSALNNAKATPLKRTHSERNSLQDCQLRFVFHPSREKRFMWRRQLRELVWEWDNIDRREVNNSLAHAQSPCVIKCVIITGSAGSPVHGKSELHFHVTAAAKPRATEFPGFCGTQTLGAGLNMQP